MTVSATGVMNYVNQGGVQGTAPFGMTVAYVI